MNPQRQRLFGILIFLIVIALAYFTVWPTVSDAYAKFLHLQKTRQELADLRFLIQNKSDYFSRYERFRANNMTLFKMFSEKFSESEPIVSMNTLANATGLQLSAIDVQKPDEKGTIVLRASLDGVLDSLASFLRMAGNSLPLFDFVATRFDSLTKSQTFNVEMQTFALPTIPAPAASTVSYTDLKAQLEQALKTSPDSASNEQLKLFKPAGEIPVPLPSADTLGGHDPFRPQ